MKISGNEVRPGVILNYSGRLMTAVKTQHVKPGKGPAYMQVELKDIIDGTKMNERLRSDQTLERVRLEEDPYQYLYDEGEQLAFMNQENYEQISLDKDLLGDQIDFLEEGMVVTISSYEGRYVAASIPDSITMEVAEAEPVVKGQTASSSYKPAVLTNGVRVMVPPHITTGTRIVVNTQTREYLERAKD